MPENSWAVGATAGAATSMTALLTLILYFYARNELKRLDTGEALITFFSFTVFGACPGAIAGALGWPVLISCAGGALIALLLMLFSRRMQKPNGPQA